MYIPPTKQFSTVPASPLQIKTIKEVTERLKSFGFIVAVLDDYELSLLTGGKYGTAYLHINYLISVEEENKGKMPMTQKQVEYISQMLYCPDIDWDEYEVDNKFYYENGSKYKMMTREEFEKELKLKLTKEDAEEFLYKYTTVFNEWRKTRIRPNQEIVIRKYEHYLSSLEYRRERNLNEEIKAEIQEEKSLRTVYNPVAHIPLEEFQLKQFSKEQASAYMKQLKYSIDAKRLYKFNKERNKDDDFEKLRDVKTPSDWATRELRTLNSIIYSLQKESGVINEKVSHLIPYQDIYTMASKDDPFFSDTKKHIMIIDYMYYIVANHAITFDFLRTKCQRSRMAIKFLEATKNRLLKDRKYMESLLYR